MALPIASLPAGSRLTDGISLGVIAKCRRAEKGREIFQKTNRASIRERGKRGAASAQNSASGCARRSWRAVSLDASTLEVADTAGNEEAFGRTQAAPQPDHPRHSGPKPTCVP